MPLTLREALNRDDLGEAGTVPFTAATEFSGRVTPGGLFAGLRGRDVHGAWFWEDAVERGAAVVLTDEPLSECPIPVAVFTPWRGDVRQAFGEVCHQLHGRPSERLFVAGVTGTNGKSTVCWLLRSIFREAMRVKYKPPIAGLCGTIETDDGREIVPSQLTTPACEDLHAWLARCVANGCEAAAVELSSHALDQDRAAGLRLSSAVITNVTRDHLDYHGSLESVAEAKAEIVDLLADDGRLIGCIDDPLVERILLKQSARDQRATKVTGFGFDCAGSGRISAAGCGPVGSTFVLGNAGFQPPPRRLSLPLLGRFNVLNAAAAAVALTSFDPRAVALGLAKVSPVPGRLEEIECGQPFRVLVDYAHTPDGLRAVIDAVRPLCEGRLHLLVGAGGDRDRGKRAEMGAAAGLADCVVFTSDNPRSEDPHAILRDLAAGHPDPARYEIIEDRRAAIAAALSAARPRDWVLICGKGHETTQEVAGVYHPFDDRVVCREILASPGFAGD
ncbi:UDP-N-acetylmuramoyl-L-alanyl-D-glutamate--2,6-diaminopimelate ligase [Alienimonas chondri]|uniref:UDP-N-acetylmuramoyl-L-alanyl-D-glutamate--2,6-diaminopimelate ligase n=1 Tax=Alienimonas chondri TaxID=2681879 RepID=A0ABX1V7E7_9PLAN|nr:UDP-N-acetylmuramoyl-L-alanyl-D-glutamate--2,6-diaminopimelate ligase [Alienimonas chondri]NNJ24147.1 UDP-N-acetylmuramoyl-L-alanyl-D-glutamate--2,6-diaminopimelate ligase [Alienimonas chondri]